MPPLAQRITRLQKDHLVLQCSGTDCQETFDPYGHDYFMVAGNVYRGRDGGLIGNNFKDEDMVELGAVTIFCKRCLLQALGFKLVPIIVPGEFFPAEKLRVGDKFGEGFFL